MNKLIYLCLFILVPVLAASQGYEDDLLRGSIPEIALRPERGESPRYPEDIVIGALGRGNASDASYFYANTICTGLLSGRADHPAFSSVNAARINNYLAQLGVIAPASFRIGGGRNEADGAVSFLIRFIGRDMGITGELYIRYITRNIENSDGEITQTGSWVFEDLYFDEPVSRVVENQDGINRNNLYPYERFF